MKYDDNFAFFRFKCARNAPSKLKLITLSYISNSFSFLLFHFSFFCFLIKVNRPLFRLFSSLQKNITQFFAPNICENVLPVYSPGIQSYNL